MKVKEFITLLQTFDQELPVAHGQWSEYVLLDEGEPSVCKLQVQRPDGWIHSARPDTPCIDYLVLC